MPMTKWTQNLLKEFGKIARLAADVAVEVVAEVDGMKSEIAGQRDGSRQPVNRCRSTMKRMSTKI